MAASMVDLSVGRRVFDSAVHSAEMSVVLSAVKTAAQMVAMRVVRWAVSLAVD